MKTYIHLPYVFNVRNTTTLIEDFTNIPFDQNLKIASFDTDNMNSNVPIDELLNIINIICDKYIMEDKLKQEVIKVSKLLTDQNYFIFQNGVHLQKEGFTMGAPTSSNFSEIYWQCIENTKICDVLMDSQVEEYFRNVDDILIVYRENHTNINKFLDKFSSLIPSMKFTLEQKRTIESISWILLRSKTKTNCPLTYTENQQLLIPLFPTIRATR